MKKNIKKIKPEDSVIENSGNRLSVAFLFLLLVTFSITSVFGQNVNTVKGVVLNPQNEPIIGATIYLKNNKKVSTITDLDGKFSLSVPAGSQAITVSYLGMKSTEVNIFKKTNVSITLQDNNQNLNEVIVVGYGEQKKASVLGAITQTSGKVLERTGGVSNLGMALAGNLPGVIVTSSTGIPGGEDPQIIIRSQTSWNNSSPLILVDGVERSMSTIDISSVESVSVLKDASATAVYGVKGANGVILITTKRGAEGKANIQIRSNITTKSASKLPQKYDAYDALMLRNTAIERELPTSAGGWASYTPMDIINKYRNPANSAEWDQYPNVDWEKELFKDHTTSYNTSVNVSGGSKDVKYFAAMDYVHEGDLFKTFQNNRGYNSSFGYDRINVRSNLDFNLSKTTSFSANLFGSNGVQTVPFGYTGDGTYWASAYRTAPDAMRPVYSDGTYGWYSPKDADVPNSVYFLAMSGIEKRTTTQLNTDFVLKQQLDMITKGLNFKATLSMDNTFKENGRGINDQYNDAQRKWINPLTGQVSYRQVTDPGTQLDYSDGIRWKNQAGSVDQGATFRKMYYTMQLNYSRKFGQHEVTGMGLFSRDETATGSEFHHYREDWVFRATYNYASKYFAEVNGAYNGSEKFGPNYRFAFFPSLSGGWIVSGEDFMKNLTFIDMLKLRGSWGKIGDDNILGGSRFLYQDSWSYGGNTLFGTIPANTPYTYYRLASLGNPNISWEVSEKKNIALDYSFVHNLISGSIDYFNDYRYNILVASRSVPSYFGASAPPANLGEVRSHGLELELKLNHKFSNGIRLWANTSMTHAVNKIMFKDDPQLLPAYQKNAGYAIGQTRSYLNTGVMSSWDDVYGSTARSTNNNNKLPGDYNIIDYNGDGVIDSYDKAPYQYSSNPQNTYNATLGFEWKGFSCFVQFYGVSNVTREVTFPTFTPSGSNAVAYVEGNYWNKNTGGNIPLPRWSTLVGEDAAGTRYLYDGSYLRLKNAEIAYTFTGRGVKMLGLQSCKLYMNGDNLLLWTKMPDDRESNFSGSSTSGAYPTLKRFNLGVDITL
jgi:TonB-linked outer membrane protein, SusC/RagA family